MKNIIIILFLVFIGQVKAGEQECSISKPCITSTMECNQWTGCQPRITYDYGIQESNCHNRPTGHVNNWGEENYLKFRHCLSIHARLTGDRNYQVHLADNPNNYPNNQITELNYQQRDSATNPNGANNNTQNNWAQNWNNQNQDNNWSGQWNQNHGENQSEEPVIAGCEERLPPKAMSRIKRGCRLGDNSVDCKKYNSFFGGFPGTTSIRFFALKQNQYAAFEFEVDRVSNSARIDLNTDALQHVPIRKGPIMWSISKCPGDFHKDAIIEDFGEGCFKSGMFSAAFYFGGRNHRFNSRRCGIKFEPGTKYYLNITFSDDDPSQVGGENIQYKCETGDTCGFQVQPTSVVGW